jgi:16S rRNA (guanine527-N7)-methyltransferase
LSAALSAAFATLAVEESVARRLEQYVGILLERNAALNLTGAKDVASALDHVRDSLRLLPYVREPLVDIGSGGGFPAIPLAIASGLRMTLVESVLKKARFLEEVVKELDLPVTVRAGRAEDAARDLALRETFASATARAVASVTAVLELTVPFLSLGGIAVLQRGSLSAQETAAAADAALVLGARVEGTVPSADEDDKRCLLLVRKTAATGQRFPRRAGIPTKRPLCWEGSDA